MTAPVRCTDGMYGYVHGHTGVIRAALQEPSRKVRCAALRADTAGVGENSPIIRAAALETLGFAGVEIDPERNERRERGIRRISTDASEVSVLVVPTNEELEIARQTLGVAQG